MDDDPDLVIQSALSDLQRRMSADGPTAIDEWFNEWGAIHPRWVGIFLSATNVARQGILTTPPGPNQQIVIREMGDGNVIQIASSNSPSAPVSNQEPTKISWRDAAPYLAALASATVAIAWFIPIPHDWRVGITVVPLVAILAYAIAAWLQARMSTWEKRVLYGLATLVTAEVCLRRYFSGWSVEAGHSADKVWFHLLPQEADDPFVVAAKLGLAALLVVLAFFTNAASPAKLPQA